MSFPLECIPSSIRTTSVILVCVYADGSASFASATRPAIPLLLDRSIRTRTVSDIAICGDVKTGSTRNSPRASEGW